MKGFLENNKIYFETISALLLGIMAVIVSILSFKISDRQYELSYFESRPDFTIQQSEVKNDSSCYIEAVNLIIKRSGGKAKNMNIRTAAFLNLRIIQKNFTENWKRKLIFNYYSGGSDTVKNDENYYIFYGNSNNRDFVNLWSTIKTELEDSVYENKYWHCEPRLTEYVEISYLNFENEIFTEYYEIKLGQGYLIKPEIGIKAFFDYDKQLFLCKSIWLDNINVMDVKKILKELFEMEDYPPPREEMLFNYERDKKYRDMFREEYGSIRDSLIFYFSPLTLSKE